MEYSVSESLGEGWGDVRLVFIAERESKSVQEKKRERERKCVYVCLLGVEGGDTGAPRGSVGPSGPMLLFCA